MSEGFRQAGYRVVGAIESDAGAVQTYQLNHSHVHVWQEDIRRVSSRSILKKLRLKKGELDLLGGCPPCQGFSTLRTRNGRRRIRDERNDLVFEFQRLVFDLRPKCVMLENVPALIKDQRLRNFVKNLKDTGYAVRAGILNVAEYGVPQRRNRTVVVASRVGTPHFATTVRSPITVRRAIGFLPPAGESGDSLHDFPESRTAVVRKRIASIPKDGGSRKDLPRRLRLKCHEDSDGFSDVYGRMAWDEPAPTITTGCFNPSKGRFLHPTENRAISIREAALLQSFPLTYKFPVELGKVKLAEMIGNALPPLFICRHAEVLNRSVSHG